MTQPIAEASFPVLPPQQTSAPLRSPLRQTPKAQPFGSHPSGAFSSVQSLIYLIVIAIFIITFTVQPFRIPSESMEPTLLVGDFILVNKQSALPNGSGGVLPSAIVHRGDIIVFHDPVDTSLHLIKRVVGLPGDHLRLRGGRVLINGQQLAESYAVYRRSAPDNFRDNFPRFRTADPEIDSRWWIQMRSLIDGDDLIIPAGDYFVLGDNRNDSEDSRYWGFVPRDAIVGKPILIYFSLRQHSNDEPYSASHPSLGSRQPRTRFDAILDLARWGRTLQIVH